MIHTANAKKPLKDKGEDRTKSGLERVPVIAR
jgi:hypothetical protein